MGTESAPVRGVIPASVGHLVEACFGPDGPIARSQPGFVARPEQVALSCAIFDGFTSGQPLLAEGPPGTGKTLAGAVPAVLHAAMGKRVLIAATTHELLSQTYRTVVAVVAALGLTGKVAVTLLRGRANYTCGKRVDARLADPEFHETRGMTSEEASDHTRLLEWLAEGNVDLTDAPVPVPEKRRKLLLATAASCKKERLTGCDHTEKVESDGTISQPLRCGYGLARRGALNSEIVITTLAMALLNLDADTDERPPLLGHYDLKLFDEAHEIPKAAFEAKHEEFGVRFALDPIQDASVALGKAIDREGDGQKRSVLRNNLYAIGKYREALEGIWTRLTEHAIRTGKAQASEDTANGVPEGESDLLEVRVDAKVCEELKDPVEELVELSTEIDGICLRVVKDHRDGSITKFAKHLAFALGPDLKSWVRWVATYPKGLPKDAKLHCAPAYTRPIVERLLHEDTHAVACMSATLTAGGRFDWAKRELAMPDNVRVVQVPSPFNFPKQALWYRPQGIPKYERRGPQHAEYASKVIPALRELVRTVGGRTLVLCGAKLDFHIARKALSELPYTVYEQGVGGLSSSEIARRFKADRGSCIIGSNTFGTGFDAPGDTLECVVMLRPPWPRQGPVDEHNKLRCEAANVSWFGIDYEPRMLITAQQWFGRGIRTATDICVFAVFDPRVNETMHTAFARSLPKGIPNATHLADVAAFYERVRAAQT